MLAQKPTEFKWSNRETTIRKNKNKGQTAVLDKIDLSGLEEWTGAEQEEAWELM